MTSRNGLASLLRPEELQHAAGSGNVYLWEQQLLNTPVPAQG